MKLLPPTALRPFFAVWLSQLASLLASAAVVFTLNIWAYKQTGAATTVAMTAFFFLTPMLVMSPVAGVLVDRGNLKRMMMLSDVVAALVTAVLLLLHVGGRLAVVHVYAAAATMSTFQAFQWPACSAATSLMLPKEHYARAGGVMELAENASGIFAPMLAGMLMPIFGPAGTLTGALVAFGCSITLLWQTPVPSARAVHSGPRAGERLSPRQLLSELLFGLRYILARPPLLGVQLVLLGSNFFTSLSESVESAMILARSGGSTVVLGVVSACGAVGGVVGGLVMGVWGGPKRRIHGILGGCILVSVLGQVLMGTARGVVPWAMAGFFWVFFDPIVNASNHALWQAKVPPALQGRVFSTRRLIAYLVSPLAQLLAGPLVDGVLEPGMRPGLPLAGAMGWLVGTGPGAGMGLLFVASGVLALAVSLAGYLVAAVREADARLPDHDEGLASAASE